MAEYADRVRAAFPTSFLQDVCQFVACRLGGGGMIFEIRLLGYTEVPVTQSPDGLPIYSPTLVGREHELDVLERLIAQAQAGDGRTLLITGEAGVGKSRLAAEAARRAAQHGFALLRVRYFEPDRALPYAGLIDMLRAEFGSRAPAAAVAALGPLAPHLVGLLPEYAALLPADMPLPALEPAQERQRITQAFISFFAQRAAHVPLLVLIEDLHWSDAASLGVLHALARRLGAWPVLLLATCRIDEASPDVANMLDALTLERIAGTLVLERLSFEHTDAMLRAIFHQRQPIRGDFLAELYNLTEGNPFFIEEVLSALIAAGDIFLRDGQWTRKPLAELHIPRSIQAAIRQRLAGLSPAARHLANLAAVAGRHFDFELLRRLTSSDESTLLDQIKELIGAQLVAEQTAERFAFRHALTHAALYNGLLARERRALHAVVAVAQEVIAAEHGDEALEQWAADLGRQFFLAEEWARAAHYAQMAAARAQRLYAPALALEQLDHAIAAVEQLRKPIPAALLQARGGLYEMLGAAEAALADYRAALAEAQADDDHEGQWRVLLAIGFYYAARDNVMMGAYLRQALDLARGLGAPLLLGQSLNRYGNWYLFLEQPTTALRYHTEALALFEAAGDRPGLAATHDLIGITQIMGVDKLAAAQHYARAVELFAELGDLPGLCLARAALALRGASYYHTLAVAVADGYGAWVRDGEVALVLAKKIGWRAGEANALVYLALVHGPNGDYGLAQERADAGWALAQEIGHPVWIAGAAMARGALAYDLCDLAAARRHLEEALAVARGLGAFFMRRVVGMLALAAIAQRDFTRSSELLAPLLDASTSMETQGQRLDWLAQAELALAMGAPEQALAIGERLIATAPHAAEHGAGCIPELWRLMGLALAELGRAAEAEQALLAADSGAARLDLAPLRWRIQLALGRLYQRTGRRILARGAYAQARAIVEALAARVPDVALRARFLREAGKLLPRTSAAVPDANAPGTVLTRREREVAALIAQGQTNREIAATLVLGERTVETHLSNILGKLGLSSRRKIAAWAIEAGLVRRVE